MKANLLKGKIKMSNLVSVVIPIYNMGASIEKCVESVCNQSYKNLEVILVDDGSADNTLEVCRKIAEKDDRVFVYHTENRGSGPARNTGIENAHGDYIYFPDADDFLNNDAISMMLEATENGKYDLIVFGYESKDETGKNVFEKTFPKIEKNAGDLRSDYAQCMGGVNKLAIQGAPWNKFFSARIIKENNIEYPPLRRHQDEGFISRYMCFAEKVKFIPEILYTHFVNSLKLEWKKYPLNYEDCITGLYKVRKKTICTWNASDELTHKMVEREFICGMIKSMELLFSDKAALKHKEIKQGMVRINSIIKEFNPAMPDILGRYQKIVMKLLNKQRYTAVFKILQLKVFMEKINIAYWR